MNKRRAKSRDDLIIELELIDREVVDVTPAAAPNKTIAIVPGAFKPPHRGHLAMVEQYAANNDEVKVLISNPLKKHRALADGTVITAKNALDMWRSLAGHLENVEIEVSTAASPITAAYEFIGKDGPLSPGDVVTLGASSKGNDWQRWKGAPKYMKDGVELQNPQHTAAEPSSHSPEYMAALDSFPLKAELPSVKDSKKDPYHFHASDMRYLLGKVKDHSEAEELLEDFVGTSATVNDFLSILGITAAGQPPLAEVSSAGGMGAGPGDVQGSPGKRRRQKRKKKRNESIDMSLMEEVYNLIIKKGIVL